VRRSGRGKRIGKGRSRRPPSGFGSGFQPEKGRKLHQRGRDRPPEGASRVDQVSSTRHRRVVKGGRRALDRAGRCRPENGQRGTERRRVSRLPAVGGRADRVRQRVMTAGGAQIGCVNAFPHPDGTPVACSHAVPQPGSAPGDARSRGWPSQGPIARTAERRPPEGARPGCAARVDVRRLPLRPGLEGRTGTGVRRRGRP
jgi:hypothetical protein